MYLKHKATGDLVEVMEMGALFDPNQGNVEGRFHAGEEMQDKQSFAKAELVFPSDEGLPRCWLDANYRSH